MWSCPRCRAKVDNSFEVCWSCGTSPAGKEDPDFARADDVGPILDPPWKTDHKLGNDLDVEVAEPEIEVSECYWAGDLFEAHFLAGQLLQEGIPATADTLDLRLVLGGLVPAGPYFGPRVRVRAGDLARARSWLADYEERQRTKRKCHHYRDS
jgi:hypothetical protein